MRLRCPAVLLFLTILVTGCGMKQLVMGEFYLSNTRYKNGIRFFQNELGKNPHDPGANYYLGRCYLADNQPQNALKYLQKAAEMNPAKADYLFWLGVAYSETRQTEMEWKSYEKALSLNPNHLESRIYLAHTQMERGRYLDAVENYALVLKKWPDEPASLYNRALALKYLERTSEEEAAWKEYLDFYPSGPMARTAVAHLNSLGNFAYRNHIIGRRTITLRKIQFEPLSAKLTSEAKEGLGFLGEILTAAVDVSIHVVVYQKNNKKLAEQKAKNIKKYLIEQYPKIASSRIKVSWFDVSETVRITDKNFRMDESVNFIAAG